MHDSRLAEGIDNDAKRLQIAKKLETHLVTLEGLKPLNRMTADQVLDLARSVATSDG